MGFLCVIVYVILIFFSGEKKLPERGCTLLYFSAIRQGHTEVVVTYQAEKQFLQASVTIAAYNPLKVTFFVSQKNFVS
jgi:hypothetical protein